MIWKVPAAPAGASKRIPTVVASMPASRVPGLSAGSRGPAPRAAPLASIESTSDDAGTMLGRAVASLQAARLLWREEARRAVALLEAS